MKTPLALLFGLIALFALCGYSNATQAVAATSFGPDDEMVGTLPAFVDPGDLDRWGKGSKKEKVRPGDEYCNVDGVCVKNTKDSNGNATVDPRGGTSNAATTVATRTGFEGEISGLDSNDTADLGSSNEATVSGEGGTVNVGGGSKVTVQNGEGGGDMTVNLPSGTTVTVSPGSTTTVTT